MGFGDVGGVEVVEEVLFDELVGVVGFDIIGFECFILLKYFCVSLMVLV